MSALSNYTEADLEALAIEQLGQYLSRGRTGARAQDAAGRAADALWELRTRQRLASGERDLNGFGTAYRAIASRIYNAVADQQKDVWVYSKIATAMQRRMPARREAYLAEQEQQS